VNNIKLENLPTLFHHSVEKGALLLISAILAIVLANSERGSSVYQFFAQQNIQINVGIWLLSFSMHQLVNDFLMSIFFLVIGIEIKREIINGDLRTRSQRLMPTFAAIFGVVFPIIIYIVFNFKDNVAMKGWAIPASTDIAFSLALFSIFGKGLPKSLKVFLTALAVIDDLIAIFIIAVFYNHGLYYIYFIPISISMLFLYSLNRLQVSLLSPYIIIGCFMWYFFLHSGIHCTVSGVILGLFIPYNSCEKLNYNLKLLELASRRCTEYIALPLFAFINSGIILKSNVFEQFTTNVVMGITLGLVLGKIFGISLSIHILRIFKLFRLPEGVFMQHYYFASMICGIGFTMSLFVGLIAFKGNSHYIEMSRIGVMSGSVISAFLAIILSKILK